MSDFYISTL